MVAINSPVTIALANIRAKIRKAPTAVFFLGPKFDVTPKKGISIERVSKIYNDCMITTKSIGTILSTSA